VDAALAATTVETQQEAYYQALRQAHEGHWDFAPGYLDAPYAMSARIDVSHPALGAPAN